MNQMNKTRGISYWRHGQGLPVVLLHGFPLDHRIFDEVAADLAARWTVITPDLPGFGQSVPPRAFSLQSLADELHEFFTELKILPCVLGGLSMGGYASLAYARKYGSTLRGLLLIDTKAAADPPQAKENRNAMIQTVAHGGARAVAAQMLPKVLAPAAQDGVRDRARRIMEACPAKTIEYASLAMRDRDDSTPMLSSIAAPTLIVVGADDAITPPAVAEEMRQAIPKAQLAIIAGAGHLSPMEQPKRVAAAIDRFLAALPVA
jgi:pimeloyl-ACP methyl ester carboxylesterase